MDDEEMLLELNVLRLKGLGYKVVTSPSGLDAVKVFEAEPARFDLVITDYTMPHMTGMDLAGKLLEIRPGVPIILSSGLNEGFGPEVIENTGIRAFTTKTASKRELAETIRRVLDQEKGTAQ